MLPSIDPRPALAAIAAAYALPAGNAVDVIYGNDIRGRSPYAVVLMTDGAYELAFRGTWNFPEVLMDADALPVATAAGKMAMGIAATYNTLTTGSGFPLSTYAKARVYGHSRGANLAAAWVSQFKSPEYCLFAYPPLCGQEIVTALETTPGAIYRMHGDPVANLFTFWPEIPQDNTTWLRAVGTSIDPLYFHALSTYQAAISALYAA